MVPYYMAKKSKRNAVKNTNLILMVIGVVMAVLAWVGLACNFINVKRTLLGISDTQQLNLSHWFDTINDFQDYSEVAGWQIARSLLIVTTVVLVVMTVLMVAKVLMKHSLLKWLTLGVSVAAIACAAIFMITTFIGCGALTGNIDVMATGIEYSVNVGVFLFGIGAMISAICATIVAVRK